MKMIPPDRIKMCELLSPAAILSMHLNIIIRL